MPEGMLGKLSLCDVRGPRNDLEERLAGKHGAEWLLALKRFLRKEDPWPIDPEYEELRKKLLQPVSVLKLSPRINRIFERENIRVLADICQKSSREVRGMHHLGKKSFDEIQEALGRLYLRMDAEFPLGFLPES